MATYYVKTHGNRHLVFEADSFDFDTESACYKFVRETESPSGIIIRKTVASVPRTGEILAVVEVESMKSDSYYSIVGSAKPDVRQGKAEILVPRVEFRMLSDDHPAWGFVDDGRFFPFENEEDAKNGALDYAQGTREYESVPLDETTLIPGVIQ